MEGILIGFLFDLVGAAFSLCINLIEGVICNVFLWKSQHDKKVAAECEEYYSNSRDFFGEEY